MRSTLLILLALLFGLTGVTAAEPMVPVSAELNVSALQPGKSATLSVVLDIPAGFHGQSNAPLQDYLIPTTVKLEASPDIKFGPVVYPPGRVEKFAALGTLSVYSGKTVLSVPVDVLASAKPQSITLSGSVQIQICDDKTCFRPQKRPFSVKTEIVSIETAVTTKSPTTAPVIQADTDTRGLGSALALAFLAGLIFNVMPCVLPVLPLKAIGFYEVAQHHRAKTLLLGAAFSVGMLAIFAVLAVIVLLSKQIFGAQFSWGQQFSSPIFVWTVSLILIALGLGLLGLFAVRLPTGIYGLDFRHDTIVGNVMWGGLTAVLSTPCTAPFFPVVIAFAIVQPTAIGILLVMMVGVGMAAPYLLLSAFPEVARRFPRTGPTSELVKQMMGFLMLGSAAFFIGSTLNWDGAQGWLIFVVAVIAAIFLLVRTRQLFKTSTALVVSSIIALLMTGVSLWAALPVVELPWEPYTPARLAEARRTQTVLVKFTAKWCGNCKVLEQTVYRDPRVFAAVKQHNVLPIKLDVDKAGWDLLNQLAPGAGIPFTAIYMPGQEQPIILASVHDTQSLLDALTTPVPQPKSVGNGP